MAQQIKRYATTDGSHSTAIASLHFSRTSYLEGPVYAVQGPALCIIVQGAKKFMVAESSYHYAPFHYLVVSLGLPHIGQITQADPQFPLLCISLHFEPELIFDIIQNTDLSMSVKSDSHRGMFVGEINLPLLDAGFQVGYESPSQFSREYARMFVLPPKSDAKHLRDSLSLRSN